MHIYLELQDTYHPRFVTEVVNRVQRVNRWQAGVLQPDHHVAMVSVLVHAEGVLSDQHKVWLEGPGMQEHIQKVMEWDGNEHALYCLSCWNEWKQNENLSTGYI